MKHRIVILFSLLIVILGGIIYLSLKEPQKQSDGQGNNGENISSSSVNESSSDTPSLPDDGDNQIDMEMKAVWVPFMSMDMSNGEKGREVFEKKVDDIVENVKTMGFNTLIVHTRPFGDAIYPSSYYPWSHILTGTQGMDPGYDPMEYWVEAAHEAGLEIHAWINPLRIKAGQTPSELSSNNPYYMWQNDTIAENNQWIAELESGIYYNPAYDGVRKYIIDGVRELVEKYDVDGVHMDDYFYPTQDESFDKSAYDAYCASVEGEGEPLSLADWRKQNINMLVSGIYSAVKSIDPNIVFGISPQGNMENCEGMYADIATWGSTEGYVDYLCPQMYFTFENSYQPYGEVASEWRKLVSNPEIKLYAGLGLYKAGSDDDNGQWAESDDIIRREIEYAQSQEYDGFMLYSYDYLQTEQTEKEVENILECINQNYQ